MIRRLVIIAVLALGLMVAGAAGASARNVVCAYNTDPLNIGICAGI